MRTFSDRHNSWPLTLLCLFCAVQVCRAAADPSAAAVVAIRADQSGHESGQTRKLLMSLGSVKSEIFSGRYTDRPAKSFGFDASAANLRSEAEVDAVRAPLANLNWVSRRKTLEEAGRRFHQEGLPLAHLWQSNSSDLSFGINPDKKPGLWFVKRLP
jgi:hypothetical protein